MRCDRCKEDFCMWTELIAVSAKSLKPELGYRDKPSGGKPAFCGDCLPVVIKRVIDVRVLEAPITERYWEPGMEAMLDLKTNKIRVGGCWFDCDERWKLEDIDG